MTRRLAPIVVVAALLGAVPSAPASVRAESFVQVVEKEWSLVLSRPSVRAGRVTIELVNFGTDAHDLVVQAQRKGAKPLTVRFSQLAPKGRAERTLRLRPGRYALWCSLPGHRPRGMRATLVVRR